ncbi:hypothetical protein [Lysobacter enzymogenes]|uniref:hypothetical protein n=1 Tax=Lysobacter enzymogenes TaxID=69 RepID=UPI001AF57320|nr:hypothetical protein [Lysobacter enzymogenes]QQQ00944.1 hypothetical protein JHW41_23235 [Lysobacter enzymogenes]
MTRILGCFLLVLLMCGFKATVGSNFNEANLPQLKIGQTTLAEATKLLGRPADSTQVGQSGVIGHTWTYVVTKASMWTGNVKGSTKSVMLVFNTDGTFQRILTMEGIVLPSEDMQRLVAEPAAARAKTP